MTEWDRENGEHSEDEAPRSLTPTRAIGLALLCVYAATCVFWFTSLHANVPFPSPLVKWTTEAWLHDIPLEDLVERDFPASERGEEGAPNFLDLYGPGFSTGILRAWSAALSPWTWLDVRIGIESIDWWGHAEALAAILIYTLLGVFATGAMGIRWPWPTRLAISYALGVGIGGWVFEQWAIAYLLNRFTVLGSLAVLFGVLGWLWWRAADAEAPLDVGEPELGPGHAVALHDFLFRAAVWAVLVIVVALSFVHAVAFPPANWDALILYLGNAAQTHEAGGFPIKVVAQVGVGLGANYPHLFEVTQAAITRLGGHWTPLVGQWAVPWASLCATVLVFALAHRAFRRTDIALAAALVFRASFYMVSFTQLASNYPLAILMTAGVLLCAYDWLATGRRGFAVCLLLLAAFASHINYLMPCLWGVAILALVFRGLHEIAHPESESRTRRPGPSHAWGGVALALVLSLAMGSSWYVRNWVVTGNPVYAFFSDVFGGRNINDDVLASADVEWLINGDGVGRLAAQEGSRTTLGRLRVLPRYLYLEPALSLKLAPLFTALALPGLIMVVGAMVGWGRQRLFDAPERRAWWILVLIVFLGLWVYHLTLADHYLYQILPMMVPAALLAAVPLALGGAAGGVLRALVLFTAVTITVPFSLMGMKIKRLEDQLTLHALTRPFPDEMLFYRRVFPEDVPIWMELEANWRGARLLTHDNRHLIYDPLVEIVHLDDAEVQPIYQMTTNRERLDLLRGLGVDLYLRVPNEANHVANSWAGMQGLIDAGELRYISVAESGGNALYAFPWVEEP